MAFCHLVHLLLESLIQQSTMVFYNSKRLYTLIIAISFLHKAFLCITSVFQSCDSYSIDPLFFRSKNNFLSFLCFSYKTELLDLVRGRYVHGQAIPFLHLFLNMFYHFQHLFYGLFWLSRTSVLWAVLAGCVSSQRFPPNLKETRVIMHSTSHKL